MFCSHFGPIIRYMRERAHWCGAGGVTSTPPTNTSPLSHSPPSLTLQPYDTNKFSLFSFYSLNKRNSSQSIYNIVFKSGETLNGASVFAFTSSTVTPSATSISVRPSVEFTSKTASSVMILETHFWPVKGNVHSVKASAGVLYFQE
jgi:hypothetical protein